MSKLNKWAEGVLFAAAEITRGHGNGIEQVDLLDAAGLSEADCSSISEFDQEFLKQLNDASPRLNLTFS